MGFRSLRVKLNIDGVTVRYTNDVDERNTRRLVDELIENDVVTPIPDQRVLVREPSSTPFESITQLAVFHLGWQAATDADTEDD